MAQCYGFGSSVLCGGSKVRKVSRTKTIFIWIAVYELGYTGVEAAQWLGITPSSVSKALHQGRKLENKEEISNIIREVLIKS